MARPLRPRALCCTVGARARRHSHTSIVGREGTRVPCSTPALSVLFQSCSHLVVLVPQRLRIAPKLTVAASEGGPTGDALLVLQQQHLAQRQLTAAAGPAAGVVPPSIVHRPARGAPAIAVLICAHERRNNSVVPTCAHSRQHSMSEVGVRVGLLLESGPGISGAGCGMLH